MRLASQAKESRFLKSLNIGYAYMLLRRIAFKNYWRNETFSFESYLFLEQSGSPYIRHSWNKTHFGAQLFLYGYLEAIRQTTLVAASKTLASMRCHPNCIPNYFLQVVLPKTRRRREDKNVKNKGNSTVSKCTKGIRCTYAPSSWKKNPPIRLLLYILISPTI